MKKGIIAVAALIAASGLSIGAFLAVKDKDSKENAKKNAELAENELAKIPDNTIEKIQIHSADGDYTLVLDGETWVNDPSSGNDFTINQNQPMGICTVLKAFKAYKNYGGITDESKQKYGLTDPYVLTVTAGNESYTVNIGDASPTGGFYYATVDGKDKIYAILADDANTLTCSRSELIDPKIIPYAETDISQITVKRDGKVSYDISRDPATGNWKLPDEYSLLTVNQTRPSTILTVLTRLEATQIVEENLTDLAKYGFDKPYAELEVKSSDGSSSTVLFSRYGKDASTTTHALLKNTGLVETFYTSDISFTDYSIYDLIMQSVESANIYDVTGFEISCSEMTDTFKVDMKNNTASLSAGSLDLSKTEVKNMLENFYNSFSYVDISGIDLDAKPVLADTVLSAKYTRSSGDTVSIDLVPTGSDDECYVFFGGKYTGTKTNADFITGQNSMKSMYDMLCGYAN